MNSFGIGFQAYNLYGGDPLSTRALIYATITARLYHRHDGSLAEPYVSLRHILTWLFYRQLCWAFSTTSLFILAGTHTSWQLPFHMPLCSGAYRHVCFPSSTGEVSGASYSRCSAFWLLQQPHIVLQNYDGNHNIQFILRGDINPRDRPEPPFYPASPFQLIFDALFIWVAFAHINRHKPNRSIDLAIGHILLTGVLPHLMAISARTSPTATSPLLLYHQQICHFIYRGHEALYTTVIRLTNRTKFSRFWICWLTRTFNRTKCYLRSTYHSSTVAGTACLLRRRHNYKIPWSVDLNYTPPAILPAQLPLDHSRIYAV